MPTPDAIDLVRSDLAGQQQPHDEPVRPLQRLSERRRMLTVPVWWHLISGRFHVSTYSFSNRLQNTHRRMIVMSSRRVNEVIYSPLHVLT